MMGPPGQHAAFRVWPSEGAVVEHDDADARRDRPTMRDVAALAGVGVKTVSRVVNDVPTVAPELVQRVRAAAERLGYRPNLTAASLRRTGGRTNTIGLLLEDVSNLWVPKTMPPGDIRG